jgi:hypothetical protein
MTPLEARPLCCAKDCKRKATWLVDFVGETSRMKFEVPACGPHSKKATTLRYKPRALSGGSRGE